MRILGNNGSVQQTVSTGYGEDGRIVSAGFVHGGAQKLFTYSYLPGSHLLQSLVKPNNMTLTLSYEDKRDLLTGMLYKRSNTQVASRSYTYDTLGRPTSRGTTRDGQSVSDSFAYNNRSELTSATVSGESYAYDYDNIGNRETAQEAAETVTAYATNSLNQYTAIGDFVPTFDDAGNQTLVKTSTGIWAVTYDAENRPTLFSNAESSTTVECSYDYMGRRATKKVTVNGSVTLHQRYIYRGYLQIASCDLTRTAQTALWLLTWDPTQTTATRPLAIQINGTWFTYGWDLTKNICEVYGQHGYIRTAYTYTPYGSVTMSGDLIQSIQWSSEYHDTELALVYYNYRHYNPTDGRWLGRDTEGELAGVNLYVYTTEPIHKYDLKGNRLKRIDYLNPVESNNMNEGGSAKATYGIDFIVNEGVCYSELTMKSDFRLDVKYRRDKNGYNKKHEMHHGAINLKYWNMIVEEISYLERRYFGNGAKKAMAYAKATLAYRNTQSCLENFEFDVNEYIYRGFEKSYLYNEALQNYNKCYARLKAERIAYNESLRAFYSSEVEGKKPKIKKGTTFTKNPVKSDFVSPIK